MKEMLELRAQVDRMEIELEAIRRTLSGLVDHFDDRLRKEREEARQEFNPEAA